MRRFYRLDDHNDDVEDQPVVDYARGGVLMESSDEEDDGPAEESEEEDDGVVTLGQHRSKPIHVLDEDEIDLNEEDDFADLDAEAEAARQAQADEEDDRPAVEATRRIAAVNLDWDHVRAIHLWKIFSSLLEPEAAVGGSSKRSRTNTRLPLGKLLSVRVYPSEFGKERMAKEERDGPPAEVFKKKKPAEDDLDVKDIIADGQEDDFDEDALRKYQLDRMRYVLK